MPSRKKMSAWRRLAAQGRPCECCTELDENYSEAIQSVASPQGERSGGGASNRAVPDTLVFCKATKAYSNLGDTLPQNLNCICRQVSTAVLQLVVCSGFTSPSTRLALRPDMKREEPEAPPSLKASAGRIGPAGRQHRRALAVPVSGIEPCPPQGSFGAVLSTRKAANQGTR
jgi:hypothetical protein